MNPTVSEAVMSISKARSKQIARRGRDAIVANSQTVNFDLERMKSAVAGPFRALPNSLSREQLREWMLEDGKRIPQEEKQ